MNYSVCVCVCLILCNSVGRIDLFYRENFYEQLKPWMGSEQTLYLIIRPSTFHHISKTFYLFVHPIFLLVFSLQKKYWCPKMRNYYGTIKLFFACCTFIALNFLCFCFVFILDLRVDSEKFSVRYLYRLQERERAIN